MDERTQAEALDRYLDALATGTPADEGALDRDLAQVARRYRALGRQAAPTAARDRVWHRLTVDLGRDSRVSPLVRAAPAPSSNGTAPRVVASPPARTPEMRRGRAWLELAAAVLAIALLAGSAFGGPAAIPSLRRLWHPSPAASGDVPLFRGGPARTGAQPGPGPRTAPVERWRVATGPYWPTAASVVGGTVYFGDLGGTLRAVDAATGVVRWSFTAGGPIRAAPAVAAGVVYVGDLTGLLHAVDAATGQERWQVDLAGPLVSSSPAVVDGRVLVVTETGGSSPAVVDGTVYVGGDATASGTVMTLYAVDAATGAIQWRHENNQNGLYAIDAATGRVRWSAPTGDAVRSTVPVDAGVAYVGSRDGTLYAVDAATGAERWRFATGKAITASPAVADQTVFVGSTDGTLYALDAATGAERWHVGTGSVRESAPTVADGIVYVVAGGVFRALDTQTGEERWDVSIPPNYDVSPVVVGGVIYVAWPIAGGAGLVAWADPGES
jgi:outer membrane protein assembly factor BamB